MTSKEKAKELYLKYCPYDVMYCDPLGREIEGYYERYAIRCALICCDEILLTLNRDIQDINVVGNILLDLIEYWNNVKEELLKM